MYQFGPFVFDCRHSRLYREGERVHATNKALTLLEILIEERPELVSKEDLIQRLWPESVGSEANLTVNVSALRKALGERSGQNDFVVTVPTRGYFFAAPVVDLEAEQMPVDPDLAAVRHLAVVPPSISDAIGDEAYLGHWIADALISGISERSQLAVRPLAAVLDPRVAKLEIPELARRLEVDLIVQGSLDRKNGSLQLRLELVRPRNGEVVWSDEFTDVSEDLEAMAQEVGSRLAAELDLPEPPPQLNWPRPPEDPEAFRLFLQGRYFFYQANPASMQTALEFYQRAVELEGGRCPRALASMALAYHYLVFFGALEPAEGFGMAEEALIRALSKDRASALAHAVMGATRRSLHFDWESAEQELQRAVELGPFDPMCYEYLGYHQVCLGQTQAALKNFRHALELDPSSLKLITGQAWALRAQGDYEESEAATTAVLQMDPTFMLGHYNRACNLLAQERYEEAMSALSLVEPYSILDPLLGNAQAGMGDEKGLEETLDRIRRTAGSRGNVELYQAMAMAAYPDPERSLDHLEEAVRLRSGMLTTCLQDRIFQRLEGNPRFATILRRIHPVAAAQQD